MPWGTAVPLALQLPPDFWRYGSQLSLTLEKPPRSCFVRKSSASPKGSGPVSSRSERCWGCLAPTSSGNPCRRAFQRDRSGLSAAAKGQRRPLPSEQRPFSILPCTVFSPVFLSVLIQSKSFFFQFNSMVHEGRASGGAGSRGHRFGLTFLTLKLPLLRTRAAVPSPLAAVCPVKLGCSQLRSPGRSLQAPGGLSRYMFHCK